jgi:hypothetical protein
MGLIDRWGRSHRGVCMDTQEVPQHAEMADVVRLVEALQRQVDEQQAIIQRLIAQQPVPAPAATVSAVSAAPSDGPKAGSGSGAVSRRSLMRLLGGGAAAGVAAVGTGALAASPAAAAPGNPLIIGVSNSAGASITALTGNASPNSATFASYNNSNDRGIGIYGVSGSPSKSTVLAAGVIGSSSVFNGVMGVSDSSSGVHGNGPYGVTGQSVSGIGVYAFCSEGVGLLADAGSKEVAGRFQGGRAQLHLVPSTVAGVPKTGTHKVGELYLDKIGALYLCKKAGTPGTWKVLG